MNNYLLDNDLYKFTTSYAYMKLFPRAIGTFKFHDRNGIQFDEEFIPKLKYPLYAKLFAATVERSAIDWCISNIPYIPRHYWEWLEHFKYDANQLKISLDEDRHLQIEITGPLYSITLWEVPVLAIVSEICMNYQGATFDRDYTLNNLTSKARYAEEHKIPFSDFGTRRRFSSNVQERVVSYLSRECSTFNGTSNVMMAYMNNIKPIGTHPHEWFMFHGAQFGYKRANYLALENWVNVYDGDLGIALTDTYTTDNFFANFSMKHAKLFDGVRHDSGDPFQFISKVTKRYRELGINPMTKTIVFSDGLNLELAKEIQDNCAGRINCAFGIGTNLTNDCGHKPLNIVMKLSECALTENQPMVGCVKLSDVPGKHTGKQEDIDLALQTIKQ